MATMFYIQEFLLGFIQALRINWTNLLTAASSPLTDLGIVRYLCLKSFFVLSVLNLNLNLLSAKVVYYLFLKNKTNLHRFGKN